MVNQVKTITPKTEIETFLVQGQELIVRFRAVAPQGWNDFASDVEIDSINGAPEDFFQDWILGSVREQIRVHKLKGKDYSEEYKSEQRGDEFRGN